MLENNTLSRASSGRTARADNSQSAERKSNHSDVVSKFDLEKDLPAVFGLEAEAL